MVARDIMTPHVITVTSETTVKDVANILTNNRISGVPVVDRKREDTRYSL